MRRTRKQATEFGAHRAALCLGDYSSIVPALPGMQVVRVRVRVLVPVYVLGISLVHILLPLMPSAVKTERFPSVQAANNNVGTEVSRQGNCSRFASSAGNSSHWGIVPL